MHALRIPSVRVVIGIIFILGVCILTEFLFFKASHVCRFLPFGYDYFCFARTTDSLYKNEGAPAAFVYLNSMSSEVNYGAAHLIAHQLGHALWQDTHDVETALLSVPYVEYSPTEVFRYGGVVHGIFHSYFLEMSEQGDIHVLTQHSCDQFSSENKKALLSDCTHGIGHGLMAYTNNNIEQTLALCAESAVPENCYSGAFMERGLLLIPGYAGTPEIQDSEDICLSFDPAYATACAQYAGWTAIVTDLVETRTSNTKDALQICNSYTGDMRFQCTFVAARDMFSIVYDNNTEAMKDACEEVLDVEACLQGVAAWDLWNNAYTGKLGGV